MSGPADLLFLAPQRHMSKVNLFRWEARELSVQHLTILIGSGSGGSVIVSVLGLSSGLMVCRLGGLGPIVHSAVSARSLCPR